MHLHLTLASATIWGISSPNHRRRIVSLCFSYKVYINGISLRFGICSNEIRHVAQLPCDLRAQRFCFGRIAVQFAEPHWSHRRFLSFNLWLLKVQIWRKNYFNSILTIKHLKHYVRRTTSWPFEKPTPILTHRATVAALLDDHIPLSHRVYRLACDTSPWTGRSGFWCVIPS